MKTSRSNGLAAQSRRRRSRPAVEGLEPRTLMALALAEYPVNAAGSFIPSVIDGPGGDLWFTDFINNAIGSIDPITHVVTEFPLSVSKTEPYGLVEGRDGLLYFTGFARDSIGVFNPADHSSVEYTIPTGHSSPEGIALGPDGDLWFDETLDKIGKFDPGTHQFVEYPVPASIANPRGIVLGPDGNLWFTGSDNVLGRINATTGVVTLYTLAGEVSEGITAGHDGQLWFGEAIDSGSGEVGAIAEIDPATGLVTTRFSAAESGFVGNFAAEGDGKIDYSGSIFMASHSPVIVGQFDPSTGVNTMTRARPGDDYFAGLAPVAGGGFWFSCAGSVGLASPFTVTADRSAISGDDGPFDGNLGSPDTRAIFVDLNGNGKLDAGEPSASTDPYGDYTLMGLPVGNLVVRDVPPPGGVGASSLVTTTAGQRADAVQLTVSPGSVALPLHFAPSPFGANPPDAPTAEINGLYSAILGRAPDSSALINGASAIVSGTTPSQFAAFLLTSPEYQGDVVAGYYQKFLGRAGSAAEVRGWVSRLQAGTTEARVAAAFLTSAEFDALHPTNPDDVQALYTDILGRFATAADLADDSNALGSGISRAELVAFLLGLPEAHARAVEGLYEHLLDRQADPGAVTNGVAALKAGFPLIDLAAGLVGSAEYARDINGAASLPTSLPILNRADDVFGADGILYITDGSRIDRYDTKNRSYLPAFSIPGSQLLGIDLSPDGKTLAVADQAFAGIELVDTEAGSVARESGVVASSVAWGFDGAVYYAPSLNGPLKRFDPATDVFTSTTVELSDNGLLYPSVDRKTIGIAEPFAVFNVTTGMIQASTSTGYKVVDFAPNPTGTQFVGPSGGLASVYNRSGTTLTTVATIGHFRSSGPISAIYSPTSHYLFTAESDNQAQVDGVKVYDTMTFQQIASLDAYHFDGPFGSAYGVGRMRISPDGKTLAVSVAGAIRLYDVSSFSG